MCRKAVAVTFLLFLLGPCNCLPEKSIWDTRITSKSLLDMQKSMLVSSDVYIRIYCRKDSSISVSWLLVQSPCIEMFVGLDAAVYMTKLERNMSFPQYTSFKSGFAAVQCNQSTTQFLETASAIAGKPHDPGLLVRTWEDGAYMFGFKVQCAQPECDLDLDVHVEMRNSDGTYLSAVEYPFLPFNGIMVLFYLVFVLIWLVLTIMYWHTLMRIQFYIGLVLILGLWEHLTLTAIYGNLQTMGTVSPSAVYFAELIACFKRTLARLLVLIACLGYGVTIPNLSKIWFRRCLAIGSVYFILVTMEGMTRTHYPRFHTTQFLLATLFPLMCLDAAIMWWIFIYLARTLRETRLRHSSIKHKLYRNFSYVLVVVSLVSVAFMIWSIMSFKRHFCIENWRLLWINDAFWQTLFLVIMAVIIIMWRPTASNREYAYSLLDAPLFDANEDDNEVLLENLSYPDGDSNNIRTRNAGDTDIRNQSQEPTADEKNNMPRVVPPGIRPTIVERIGIEASSGPNEQQPVWKTD